MNSSAYILLLGFLFLLACNENNSQQTVVQEPVVKMEGELSTFSCSDEKLTERFRQLSSNFDSLVNTTELSWQAALPYFRLAKPALDESAQSASSLNLIWGTYLQTGNKLAVSDMAIWEADPTTLFAEPTNLTEALLTHESYQRLAYLGITLKKEEVAQKSLQASQDIFQKFIKDQYSLDNHSFGQSLNEDLLALSMDLIPKSEASSIVRNVFEILLSEGLDPVSFKPSQHILLPTLSKYGQMDLAYRLADQMSDELAATWMITELVGIRPSLNAPGFRNPIIHPKLLSNLDFVEGQLKTPMGLLYVRLDYIKPLRVQIKVPAKATLVLPVNDPTRATIMANKSRLWMGGQPQPAPAGVKVLDVTKDGVIVELSKGKYTFEIKS